MKIAFLILAHKDPKQLVGLIESLTHPRTEIYLHIDKKSNLEEFTSYFSEAGVQVKYISNDVDIIYSSIKYIDATLILLREALKNNCDYFVLLSGQDKPTQPIDDIVDFYTKNKDISFVDFIPIPYDKLAYKGRTRTKYYNFRVKNKMETLFPPSEIKHKMSWKGWVLNIILLFRNGFRTKRNYPMNMQPYYSSQWFNFSKEAVEYILQFLDKYPEFYNFHKRSLHPEEMMLQSIVINSRLWGEVKNNNLRYIEWKEGEKHPELLSISILEELKDKKEYLFARKFEE